MTYCKEQTAFIRGNICQIVIIYKMQPQQKESWSFRKNVEVEGSANHAFNFL